MIGASLHATFAKELASISQDASVKRQAVVAQGRGDVRQRCEGDCMQFSVQRQALGDVAT